MYAVIKTGGKQYKVSPGDKIKVEQIPADIGADIQLDQVLAVGSGDQIRIGAPLVGGAAVSATVLAQGRRAKVRIFKMRRRKHYQKHQGHRQNYTELLIAQIASDLGVFKAEPRAEAATGDDLTKVEGIGPKIAELLQAEKIRSFSELASAPVDRLREILAAGGSNFATHDPTTWPEQAALAAAGDWEAFDKLKAELDGGRRA
jgi:large subunit ribosomal protein L21